MDKYPQATFPGVTQNGQTAIPRHLLQAGKPVQRSCSAIPKLKAAGTTFSLFLINDYLVSTVFFADTKKLTHANKSWLFLPASLYECRHYLVHRL
jgi:hypothetical protein